MYCVLQTKEGVMWSIIPHNRGNVDDMDYTGYTALHLATKHGHMNCVTYLVSFGCNVWLMENDSHKALDIAALYERDEIMTYLDAEQSRMAARNPKDVQHKKEKAVKKLDDNIRRLKRKQDKAIVKAEKEQKKWDKEQERGDDFKAPSNLIEKLTIRIKGATKSKATAQKESKTFSDIVDSNRKGTVSGKARSQNQFANGIGDNEGSTNDKDDQKHIDSNGEAHRMTVYDVFGGNKGSNALLMDDMQTKNSYNASMNFANSDEALDNQETPGMFHIPQIGQRAFMSSIPLDMIDSLKTDKSSHDMVENGTSEFIDTDMFSNDRHSSDSGSAGTSANVEKRMDLPWNPDSGDLLALDDQEQDSKYASLELFLELCNLTNYLHKFTQENIDLQALMLLSDAHLKEIGLGMGPRIILTNALQRRKEALSRSSALQDSDI